MIYKRKRRTPPGRRQEYSYCPMLWIRDGDGRRQVWGGSFKTKAEAKAEERRLLQERDARADLVKTKLTLNDVFDQYLKEKQTKVKASSLQRSRELLEHLRPILGSVQLNALKPARISEAYSRLLDNLKKTDGAPLPLAAARCTRAGGQLGPDTNERRFSGNSA